MNTTQISKLPNNMQQSINSNKGDDNYYTDNTVKQHSQLPEKDRIIDPEKLTRDESTRVNFIPDSENDIYYIPSRHDIQNEIQETTGQMSIHDKLRNVTFEEMKMPIILMLLYILFEFPIVRNFVKRTFSFSFDENEQLTFSGILVLGFLFAFSHFIITKVIE